MNKPVKYQQEYDRLLALGHKFKWGLYLFLTTNEQSISLLLKKQGNYDSNLQEVVANLFLIPKYVVSVKELLTALILEEKIYTYIFPIIRLLSAVHDLDIIKDAHRKDISALLLRQISDLERNTQSFVFGVRPQQAQPKQASLFLGSPGLARVMSKDSGPSPQKWVAGEVPAGVAAPDSVKKRSAGAEGEAGSFSPANTCLDEASVLSDSNEGNGSPPKMQASNSLTLELRTILSWYGRKNSGILAIRSGIVSRIKFWAITMRILINLSKDLTLSLDESELVMNGIVDCLFMIMQDTGPILTPDIKQQADIGFAYIMDRNRDFLCCGIPYDPITLLEDVPALKSYCENSKRGTETRGGFFQSSTASSTKAPTIQKFNAEDKATILSAVEVLGTVGKVSDETLLQSMNQLNRALENLYETVESLRSFLLFVNRPENANFVVTEEQKDGFIQCVQAVKELQKEIPEMPAVKPTAAARLAITINGYRKSSREVVTYMNKYGIVQSDRPLSSRDDVMKLCVVLNMVLKKNKDPTGCTNIDLGFVVSLYTAMFFQDHIASTLDLSFIGFTEGSFGLLNAKTTESEVDDPDTPNTFRSADMTLGEYGASLSPYYGPFPQLVIREQDPSSSSSFPLKSSPLSPPPVPPTVAAVIGASIGNPSGMPTITLSPGTPPGPQAASATPPSAPLVSSPIAVPWSPGVYTPSSAKASGLGGKGGSFVAGTTPGTPGSLSAATQNALRVPRPPSSTQGTPQQHSSPTPSIPALSMSCGSTTNTSTTTKRSISSAAPRNSNTGGSSERGGNTGNSGSSVGSIKCETINFRFLALLLNHGFREVQKQFSPNLHYLKRVYDDVRAYRGYARGFEEVVDSAKRAVDAKLADSLCVQLMGFALLSMDKAMSVLDTDMQYQFLISCTKRVSIAEQSGFRNFVNAIKFMGGAAVPELGAKMINRKLAEKLKEVERISPTAAPGSFPIYTLFLFQIALNMVGDLIDAGKLHYGLELPLQLSCRFRLTNAARYFLREMLRTQLYVDYLPWTEDEASFLCEIIEDMVKEAPALAVARDMYQSTLLHWAVALTFPSDLTVRLVTFLVEHGAPIDGRDYHLRSPLFRCSSIEKVYLLLGLGAPITSVNSNGIDIFGMFPEWAPDILRHEGYKQLNRPMVHPLALQTNDDDDDDYDDDDDGDDPKEVEAGKVPLKKLPHKEKITIIDVEVYSEPVGHNRQTETSLAEQFIVLAANSTSNLPLLQTPIYSWMHDEAKKLQKKRVEEIVLAATASSASSSSPASNSNVAATTATATATAATTTKKKGKDDFKGLPSYCWPLVRLGVTGDHNVTYARLHIMGLDAGEQQQQNPLVTLILYSVANTETLNEAHMREGIRESRGISKLLIGVGADVRRDQNAIHNYWEHHSLPVRLEDAVEVGRALRLLGHGECDDTPEDIRNILESAVYFHAMRTSHCSPREMESVDSRIRQLVPMMPCDSTYGEVKLLVLGHEEAGKTSVIDSLSETRGWLHIWKARKNQTVSTVGVNRVDLRLGDVPVNVYDFAGQLEYHVIHEYFLSSVGALYLVVVDGSQEDPVGQLNHWFQLLHSHSRGPRASCGVIVVCTKTDVIAKLYGEDAVEARRGFLEDAVRRWPFLSKISAPTVFMVSNKTGAGIPQLKEYMRTRLRELGRTPTAKLFLMAAAALADSAGGPFLTFGEFAKILRDNHVITEGIPENHRRHIARDALAYLSNTGRVVTSPGFEMVCTRPALMSKILSIFVCQQEHMRRLVSNITVRSRMDIITRSEFVRRLLGLNDIAGVYDSDLLCDKIIKTLESMEFCFNLTPGEARLAYGLDVGHEQCYIFPALRDFIDIASLPPEDKIKSENSIIIEMNCHGWECTYCHAVMSKPFKDGFCPSCGGYESTHICLNAKAAGHELHQEVEGRYLPVAYQENGAWVCYSMDGDRVRNVRLPKDIPCIRVVPQGTRFVCCVVSSMLEQGISMGLFNRTVATLRRWLDPHYRIFKNFAVFKDIYGNTMMATLFNRRTGASAQMMLGIIARGPLPHLFTETLRPLLELGELVTPCCPACAQFSCFSALEPVDETEAAGKEGKHEDEEKKKKCGCLRCENGHTVTTEEAHVGMASDDSLKSNSVMWGPRRASSFYAESAGKWVSAEDIEALGVAGALARPRDITGPGAYFTVLTEKEPTPARKQEYNYARSLFYNFVGKDPVNSPFRLTEVVYVDNKALEEEFAGKFASLIKKAYSTYDEASVSTPATSPKPSEAAAGTATTGATKEGTYCGICKEEAAATVIEAVNSKGGDKVLRKKMQRIAELPDVRLAAWREWIMYHLGKSLERACGNEQVNLVGGWHGTISLAAHGISRSNFRTPEDEKAVSKDPGYFGKGVYFTQSPSYGAEYAVLSAKGAKERAMKSNSALSEDNLRNCLVFSWLLLGRVYPVTEKADYDSSSLLGKPCKEGYDSHYVVLPNTSRDSKAADNSAYACMKPFDPFTKETPGYDEIVVFSKSQILPRYIFYYETNASVEKSKGGKAYLPLSLRDARTIGLWVDDSATSEGMEALQDKLHGLCNQHENVSVVSSLELRTWLRKFGSEVAPKLRILCTSFNPSDGGSNCTWRVINEVRKVAKLKKVPILVYKKPENENEKVEPVFFSRMNLVYYAKELDDIKGFIDSGKL